MDGTSPKRLFSSSTPFQMPSFAFIRGTLAPWLWE